MMKLAGSTISRKKTNSPKECTLFSKFLIKINFSLNNFKIYDPA